MIPLELPIIVSSEEELQIKQWMAAQPSSLKYDNCMNSMARWRYTVCDHGMWTAITVKDSETGEEFSPESDPDNW